MDIVLVSTSLCAGKNPTTRAANAGSCQFSSTVSPMPLTADTGAVIDTGAGAGAKEVASAGACVCDVQLMSQLE